MKIVVSILFVIASITLIGQSIDSLIIRDDMELIKPHLTESNRQDIFEKALAAGSETIAKAIIYQVDLDRCNGDGNPPLFIAISNRRPNLVKLLLQNGADPNVRQCSGLEATPIMYSVSYNDTSMTNALIKAGAQIDEIDINGDPAINWASYYGNTKSMRQLISLGADLTIKSKHGMPVDVVFRLWHGDSVAQVFREAGFGKKVSKSEQALITQVKSGNLVSVKKALDKGLSPNLSDELGTRLLHMATEAGNLPLVRLLLENGAEVNGVNRVGQTALTIASRFGHQSIVACLLTQSADPNGAGKEYNLTPLMGAAVGGHISIGKMLIDAGANPDIVDVVNSASPMIWSLFYGEKDFASMLLDHNADPTLEATEEHYTALGLAEGYGFTDLVQKIKSHNNRLLGTWKIREIQYIYPDTILYADTTYSGRLMVGLDSYAIMYNPYGAERKSPESLSKMTDKEKLYSFHTIVFNSGTYRFENDDFVTTADMAKVAGFEGGVQYYRIADENGFTSLAMYDETYPNGNKPEWYQKLEIKLILEKVD